MKDFFQNINAKVVLIVILAFLLGWQLGERDVQVKWVRFKPSVSVINKVPPENINLDFQLFWDTWDLLSRSYFNKKAIDPNKLFYGAISGMVASVGDPYTVFLTPEQQKYSQEELNGSFEGVGIQLGFNKDKRLVVMAPLDGTPAQKVGIKAQDLIVRIDNKDTTNMTLPEAVSLIRGTKGTQVTLIILREGDSDTKTFTLTRDTIIVKSVVVSYQETQSSKKVAIVKLSQFGERTENEWNSAVSDLISANSQAVVLDVRNNPGGFLDKAVFIASEFLQSGITVVMQEDSAGERTPIKVNRKGKLTEIPLVVLINKGSASASEIVAGALQDLKRAKLVGEKSFGKGTIQEAQDLKGGTGIHITVAKWLTPNGRWVNDTQGFDPDVKIEGVKDVTVTSDGQAKDSQLDKAIEILDL